MAAGGRRATAHLRCTRSIRSTSGTGSLRVKGCQFWRRGVASWAHLGPILARHPEEHHLGKILLWFVLRRPAPHHASLDSNMPPTLAQDHHVDNWCTQIVVQGQTNQLQSNERCDSNGVGGGAHTPVATVANSAWPCSVFVCGVLYGVREARDDKDGVLRHVPRSPCSLFEWLTPPSGSAQVRAAPPCPLLARSAPKAATFHAAIAWRRRRRVLRHRYLSPLPARARRHRRACTLRANASQAAFCASHSSTCSMHRWHSAPFASGPSPAQWRESCDR